MASDASEVTGLLQRWSAGDASARDRLIPLVYDRLRELAHRRRGGGGNESSLNTTALVHEAYIRLVGAPRVDLPDRAHFLALASEIMRNLLVDRARARLAQKRGSGVSAASLDELVGFSDDNLESFAELDAALHRLAHLSPRQGR
ncbi:MAG TPA: ECF-type sigma factor, partial [Gemmatimonadaceae bacterium]